MKRPLLHHSKNKICFFLFLFLIFFCQKLSAEEITPPAEEVYVGVYVNQIYALSLKDNQFSVDFYVWLRWKGKEIKPIETFEVANGRVESKEIIYEANVKGFDYACSRVLATMTKFWDINRFPLDNHTLTIEIEDSESEDFKVHYIADIENSGINPDVQVPGWKAGKSESQVVLHGYKTNYGDISLASGNESTYSRFIFSLEILRPGYSYFLKLFLSVFIATLISFLAFAIKPTDLDPRFGVGIGAIFAAVASEYVVASSLPDTNIITLADSLHIYSISFIFLSILESTISLNLFSKGHEKSSRRLDNISLFLFTGVYVIGNLFLIF